MQSRKEIIRIEGPGSTHWVGDGFLVRNLFPSNGIANEVNPFLMFDYAGPNSFPPSDRARGVEQHPHRGFETVTIAYQGSVEHRDSAGNSGIISPGDVQWMTAASGVVHEEKHEREFARRGGMFEMVQLWVNLPKSAKMSAPRYQAIAASEIPVVALSPGMQARVIAGELAGVDGPAETYTPLSLFDVTADAGSKADVDLPEGHQAAVTLLRGAIEVNEAHLLAGEAKIATLTATGSRFHIKAEKDSLFLVLSGLPIHEPVVSYGPFVMNTREELAQAFADYKSGKMGRLN